MHAFLLVRVEEWNIQLRDELGSEEEVRNMTF